jgi:hypothetical protein
VTIDGHISIKTANGNASQMNEGSTSATYQEKKNLAATTADLYCDGEW